MLNWTAIGTVATWLALIMTWAVGFIHIRRYQMDVAQQQKAAELRRREDEEAQRDLIRRVCQEFTNSDAYLLRLDRSMLTIASSVVDEAFRVRASSFVDSGVDGERRKAVDRQLASHESRLSMLEASVTALRAGLRDDFAIAASAMVEQFAETVRTIIAEHVD